MSIETSCATGLGEFEIIERYFTRSLASPDLILGIGDDAAIVAPTDPVIVATDTLVAGTHFPPELAVASIGYRALAVNLSDLAAMGATPRWFTLALTIDSADPDWLEAFASGLFACADPYNVALIGGDTTRGPLTITVQLLGTAPPGSALLRAGATIGDDVYVTGTLGDAAAGLAMLSRGSEEDAASRVLIERFARPTARVAEGLALRGLATAAIDVSDGLIADLGHVCEASGCAAVIDLELLPRSEALREKFGSAKAIDLALSGGDDYELCFTVPAGSADRVERAMSSCSGRATRIGRIVAGRGIECRENGESRPVPQPGYVHF